MTDRRMTVVDHSFRQPNSGSHAFIIETEAHPVRLTPLDRVPGLLPGTTRLAGRVTGPGLAAEELLWADVPDEVLEDVTTRLDAWLLWLLPHAFETGEELFLDGPVDAELLRHAHELMEVWSCWRPGKHPIRVIAEASDPSEQQGTRTGLFFTAGVDSFYSLLHHDELAHLHPEWKMRPVDDLIYVEGYDIPLRHRPALDRKRVALQTVAAETGKTLVTLTTNYRDTGVSLRPKAWGPIVHGPAVAASGLLLGRRWDRLLLSASFGYDELNPWGSTAVTDPLCSTSATRLWHYGADASSDRLRKMECLSRFDVAMNHLHVCWQDFSDRNCGTCEKCFRTLLALDLVGARDRASSFPAGVFSPDRLREVWTEKELVIRVYRKLRDHAAQVGRSDVVAVIDECLARPATANQP
jgi:hypothetical protein